jgi:hypothetical protein
MTDKVICKYMSLVIRNSKAKFLYDKTSVEGHTFIREDWKNGFTITEEVFQHLLDGNKIKANFGVSKGVFWLTTR